MSSGMVILAVVLTGAAAAFVLFPVIERASGPARQAALRGTTRQNQALETLEIEKRRVLRAIRDLDFDYDTAKLGGAAYQVQRVQLIRLFAAIVRRMDEIEAEIAAQDARLDAALADFRRSKSR